MHCYSRDMPAALSFHQVSKRYRGGVQALSAVSWQVEAGTSVCLLGPNGAGKSTSIRLLQGVMRPTGGVVTLLGSSVGSRGYLEARRRIGVVPQAPGMYGDFTVAEYLHLVARLHGVVSAAPVIESFGLGPYLGRRMNRLSGGFQRRLLIAAAVMPRPEVLLLDEPTVGLDPVAAFEVRRCIAEVMRGRTTLLCTHNLAEAEELCSEVVILNAGKVVLQSSIADLRLASSPHVVVAAQDGSDQLLRDLAGMGYRAIPVSSEAVRVPVSAPREEAPSLLARLMARGLAVYECRPVQASLEDVFLEAVGVA